MIHQLLSKKYLLGLLSLFILSATAFAQTRSELQALMNDDAKMLQEVQTYANDYFALVGTGKGTGYKFYQRWLYEEQFNRDNIGNKITKAMQNQVYETAIGAMNLKKSRAAWVELGPNTFTPTSSWNPGVGRCDAIAVQASNSQIMYAATPGGGVWKSIDGGTNWSPKMDGYSSAYFSITWVCIDPSNANNIYATLTSGGVIKSTDAGTTWAVAGSGVSGALKVMVHPNASNVIYATGSNGIWRSANGGTTWTQTSTSSAEDICMQPASASIMYATSAGSTTFRRSTDSGKTWIAITAGITNSGRTLIGTSANNAQVVYLTQANSNETFGRLYKSTDGGLNFTTIVTGAPASNTNYFGYEVNGSGTGGQGSYDMGIAVNPTNVNEVHIAGIICWKSTNGGTSFVATTEWSYPNATGYNHADVHQLVYVGSTLYSATDGGISKSINNADDWTNIWSGMGTKMLYRLAITNASTSTMSFGAQDNGQTYRLNGGNWNQWTGADGMDCAISPTNASVGIGTSQYGDIYFTSNGGASYGNLTKPNNGNWVTPLAWHPTDGNTVYGGWTGVYKSTNQGTSWSKISGTTITGQLNCIAVAASNANYIYASIGSTLYATTNGGTSWSTYTPGFGSISAINVNPLTPSKVYITTTNTSSNVCVSTNSGSSFTAFTAGLPALAARCIVADDAANEGVYVGMNQGVYYRNNTNTSWVLHGSSLPNVAINDIELQKAAGKIRIGTYGRGVWETDVVAAVASCGAPISLATNSITTAAATISWAAVSGATNYTPEYKASTSTTWIVLSNTTATSIAFSTLAANTTYNWRVKTNCAGGTSAYSTASFTTLNTSTCNAPTGVTASNTSANAISFTWLAVAGATNYTIEYKLSTATAWTAVTGTGTSVAVTSLAAGKYNSRIKTNCTGGSSTYANGNDFQTYCTASGNAASEYIDLVTRGTINRTSGADGGYIFLASPKPNLVPSTTYSITLSAGFAGTLYSEYFAVYIDYNRDGDFVDAGETVATHNIATGATFVKTFTVPAGVTLGNTVMRVQMKYNAAATTPCGAVGDGEIEDYAINLSSVPGMQSNAIAEIIIGKAGLNVYPNPATNSINYTVSNLENDANATAQIISADGKIVYTQIIDLLKNNTNENKINIDMLAVGVYTFRIVNDDVRMQTTFVKQ
jgi:photosystem II stability/assembly factor-like uncharacterized protein